MWPSVDVWPPTDVWPAVGAVPTIVATPEPALARVRLDLTSMPISGAVLVLRRDTSGAQVVRDTSEATVLPDGSGAVTVYDYEARQGEPTDYLATDTDGVVLATAVRVTIPAWGTWLKSIGRPFLNTRCYYGGEDPPTSTARRQLVAVEGSPLWVALSETRMSPRGSIRLATLGAAGAEAMLEVLAAGDTLMLDTTAEWAVRYRYISVGDASEVRAMGDGELGLDREQRVFRLADVAEVAPPIGVSQVNLDATYNNLPALYGSYAALAATAGDEYQDLML